MSVDKNVPEMRFGGFNDEWKNSALSVLALFNPKSELPESFKYVDLESVKGTSLTGYKTESRDSAPSRAQRLAKKGDVFYQTVRPYQKNNYLFHGVENEYVFSTGYAQLRPYFDGNFLLNLIQRDLFVKDVLNNCTGTSYPAINASTLATLGVSYPESEVEQTQIGNYFQKLDALINQHQQKHDKLNSIKKAMLEKMFPRQGETIPEIRFKGFSGEWEEVSLSDFGVATSGTSIESEFSRDGKYKVISIGSYSENSEYTDQGIRAGLSSKTENRVLKKNDLTMILNDKTLAGNIIGKVLLINEDNKYVYNQRTQRIQPFDEYDPQFLYQYLNAPLVREKIFKSSQGNTQIYVNWSAISKLKYLIPKKDEQVIIGNYFQKLDALINQHQQQITKFNNIKQACLSKMFV